MKHFDLTERILLGLVMLVPGLSNLFISTPAGVTGFMQTISLFAWAPAFWAWVLILTSILSGLAILANWKLDYAVIPPMIILLVAAFTVVWGNWPTFLLHLIVILGFARLGGYNGKKRRR